MSNSSIHNHPKNGNNPKILQCVMDKKIVAIHTMECYSVMKMNELLLIYAVVWMSLKGIMRGERSHCQKVTYCMVLFISPSGGAKGIASRLLVANGRWGV